MMSEKRFVLCKKGDKEYIEDNGCIQLYGFDVLCEMLNELNDENQKLKKENNRLAKNLKVQKGNVDANFRSAQYWRQKFESIPENIRVVWTE